MNPTGVPDFEIHIVKSSSWTVKVMEFSTSFFTNSLLKQFQQGVCEETFFENSLLFRSNLNLINYANFKI
jgi:hypothetical protein